MKGEFGNKYNDKWKIFVKRLVQKIDYFQNISDQIIDETSYLFEVLNMSKDSFLFKKGQQWKDIYIMSSGELDVYIENSNKKPMVLETLGKGCIIGTYR